MPIKLCGERGCGNPARPGLSAKGRGDVHARELERERSARRRQKAIDHAGRTVYKTAQWSALRRAVLLEQPICAIWDERLSEEVDHIRPLTSGGARYARDNVQGVCRPCHHLKTARENGRAARPR